MSDSDEDNVIRYGTPLEPIEEDDVPSKRKYQQPVDQFAVDDHGRRRFHGAFTGGFSAGFGNTVGTPEGWTPASFKSSRADRGNVSSQKPEDFMDEEDRGEFGIAPLHLQPQIDFTGRKRPRLRQAYDGPIPGEPVLQQLIEAVHETAAVTILRSMGWRPGQGTGERVSKKDKKRARDQHKVYGCSMPGMNQETQSEDSSGSEYDIDTLFAPDDYEPYVLARKDDRFGLGYSGLSRHSVLGNIMGEYGGAGGSSSHLVMKDKGKKVSIRGQAFGVGAFEAEDEDIYATEDMTHYDFAIGGAVADKHKKKPANKDSNVLEGFVRSIQPLPAIPSYPPPALPRDFVPSPAGVRRTRFEPTDDTPRDQGLGRHQLTPNARGALLGESPKQPIREAPIQPPIQTQTDPIAQIIGRNVNSISTVEETPNFIPIKDSGKELKNIFKPFVGNPQKQARYELYQSDKQAFMAERDGVIDKLSEWERDRELVEFEQAAKLYRPLTGEIGDRFTHASQPDDSTNPLQAVAKSSTNHGSASAEQIAAANQDVYGAMTRQTTSWRPDSLVCKRFNVPDPGAVRQETAKEDKPKVSYSIFSYLESSIHNKDSFAKEQSKFSGSKSVADISKTNHLETSESVKNCVQNTKNAEPNPSTSETNTGINKRMTVAELFLRESENDLKSKEIGVADTIQKFDKMDLYKSIFLSDSENEEESKDPSEDVFNFDDLIVKPKNVERNTSPPKGIFANIDFDELNSWKRKSESKSSETTNFQLSGTSQKSDKDANAEKVEEEMRQEEIYGPKIPENLLQRLGSTEPERDSFKPVFRKRRDDAIEINSSSSDSWVDVKEAKSKIKKIKKKKKHKSKHKKTKHKKKDR